MSHIDTLTEMRPAINDFLFSLPSFTKEEYWSSYPSWSTGGRGWQKLHQGGTGIMKALMWYQHRHKPGSKEWRPKIIIEALITALQEKA